MQQLSLLLWLAFAVTVNSLVADVKSARLFRRSTAQLLKREGRSACAPTFSGVEARDMRNEELVLIQRNVSAFAKRMELPGARMGFFYRDEIPGWTPIVPHESAAVAQDMSTATMQEFSKLKPATEKEAAEQYSTGTAELKGCTTMYIISHKGVYATHWWENVSFDPDKEWKPKTTTTTAEMFQDTVIDVLEKGGNYHPRLDATLIEDDYIKAYLIVPDQTWREAGPSDNGYPDLWDKIKITVGKLVPRLQDEARWTTVKYTPVGDKYKYLLKSPYSSLGKNIFKYDPQHTPKAEKKHMSALWVEEKQVHLDTW
ncbi:hypothetical protein BKA64DRAFT_745633 [Cadophora sp. MPI-SDFR-AT-0126]|nr:hypothetical protein BKA64DRAFT_745633 [Leotiomycetes sp. MPI-SDFR-AT-0126]